MSAVNHDTGEIIDAAIVEEPRREMAIVTQTPVALAVTPTVKASELGERLAVIEEAMIIAMKRDVDYGVIPGTNKPTLLKPGAEKLSVLFQLDVQLHNEKVWGAAGDHLTVISHATVFHAPSGLRLGYGEGVCTTRERKYSKRQQERTCPTCATASIIKGKQEYGGGWVCFRKKGGCGAKFIDGDPSIERQQTGEIENPDLPDLWNTVVKMAEKRARVDAVLAVTGASALFTQDAEDLPQQHDSAPAPHVDNAGTAAGRPGAAHGSGGGGQVRQPSADPATPTERPMSAAQKRLLHARADEAGLSSTAYAAAILRAAVQPDREFDSEDSAANFVHRQLARLPGRLVDSILDEIGEK